MAGSGGKIKARERDYRRMDHARARELYDAGCSDPEIARQLGVSRAAPAKWRKRNGLAANFPNDRGLKAEIVRLIQVGWSTSDIARKVGCHPVYPRVIRRALALGDEERRKLRRTYSAVEKALHNALIGRG